MAADAFIEATLVYGREISRSSRLLPFWTEVFRTLASQTGAPIAGLTHADHRQLRMYFESVRIDSVIER